MLVTTRIDLTLDSMILCLEGKRWGACCCFFIEADISPNIRDELVGEKEKRRQTRAQHELRLVSVKGAKRNVPPAMMPVLHAA